MGTPWRSGLCVGPPGLEPRMTEPKPVVLPITPWSRHLLSMIHGEFQRKTVGCCENADAKVRQ